MGQTFTESEKLHDQKLDWWWGRGGARMAILSYVGPSVYEDEKLS